MPRVVRKPAKNQVGESPQAPTTRSKPASDLLIGEFIVEYDRRKPKFHKVTAIESRRPWSQQTIVQVDGTSRWVYDLVAPVTVRVDG